MQIREGGRGPSSGESSGSTSDAKKKRNEAVTIAKKYIGTPYRYGGADPRGFDCSGYVIYVYGQLGVTLPRGTADQYAKLKTIKNPEPGDLVYFQTYAPGASHVGIFTGNNTFLHSPSTGKTVEYADMKIDYWKKAYLGARRVF